MSNDTISDMLTQIRNAIAVKHRFVIIPKTLITLAITSVLHDEGYISEYEIFEPQLEQCHNVVNTGNRVWRRCFRL
mgnify:CR=1 FL=1